jgi:hypothetical protein
MFICNKKKQSLKARGSTVLATRVLPLCTRSYVLIAYVHNGEPPVESIAQGMQLRSSSNDPQSSPEKNEYVNKTPQLKCNKPIFAIINIVII